MASIGGHYGLAGFGTNATTQRNQHILGPNSDAETRVPVGGDFRFHTKNWREDHASVKRSTYPDGTTRLTVLNRYGQILCDATVSLADVHEEPYPGHVFIRNWDENQGVLRALQDGGIVSRTRRRIDISVNTRNPLAERLVHECRLLLKD